MNFSHFVVKLKQFLIYVSWNGSGYKAVERCLEGLAHRLKLEDKIVRMSTRSSARREISAHVELEGIHNKNKRLREIVFSSE